MEFNGDVNDGIGVPFNNNNFVKDESVFTVVVGGGAEVIGREVEINDVLSICGAFLGWDGRISKSRLFATSLSVLDELSASDETKNSSSDDDDDRDNDETSWSDSIRIDSINSVLVRSFFVFKGDVKCANDFF